MAARIADGVSFGELRWISESGAETNQFGVHRIKLT